MYKLGIIGAGKMAGALVKGILGSQSYGKNEIILSDVDSDKLTRLKNEHGINVTKCNKELSENCGIVVFAVKPGDVTPVLNEIKNHVSKKTIYINCRWHKNFLYGKNAEKRVKNCKGYAK